jgi:hypothetical protein
MIACFCVRLPWYIVILENTAMARLILYEHINRGGRKRDVIGDERFLNNFDDVTSSIEIREGNWEFFPRADYQGKGRILGPGVYPWVVAVGIDNDAISSVRLVPRRVTLMLPDNDSNEAQ